MSSSDQNGESLHYGISSLSSEPTQEEVTSGDDLQPKPEPLLEMEPKSPVVNGNHNITEGLSTNYSTDTSDISIPSGSLHIDIDYEMRRQVILDLPDEIEREEDVFERSPPPLIDRARSESESSGSSSGSLSIEDGEGLEYEDEIPTDEGFDLEILEGLGGPQLSEFEEDSVGKKYEFPAMGMKFEKGETKAKLEILESFQRPVSSDPEDVSPTKSVEAEMGSVGSETSGEIVGSMQAAASIASTTSDDLNFARTDRTDSEIRLSSTIDQVLKIAAELASPTDEAYTPSFETRSLDSLMNEEGSEMGQKGYTPEEDPQSPIDYSAFMKERQLVFADSSDTDSEDSSLGVTLGETNKNLTSLEVNLDETSADLRLLEQSLAETRESLRVMESDVLSDFSTESPVFSPDGYDKQKEIELTSEMSLLEEAQLFTNSKPQSSDLRNLSDSLSEDIINANTPVSGTAYPKTEKVSKRAPINGADLVRALTPTALEPKKTKHFHDSQLPPTPPPTPKVSVVDPPANIPQISTVELHKITSFDAMLHSPPTSPSKPTSPQKVKNIAHMLPDLPPPPPLPLSPLPDSPPSSPSPLASPLTSPLKSPIQKQDMSEVFQQPPPPISASKAAPPPCAPKPARTFEAIKKSPLPPQPWAESKDPVNNDEFDVQRPVVTVGQSSRVNVHMNVHKTQYLVSKKVQTSAYTEIQKSEFTRVKTVQTSSVSNGRNIPNPETDESHKITLAFMTDNSEVSPIQRPPPPVLAPKTFMNVGQISPTSDKVIITPQSNQIRLTRPGTFVTELKMIVRPGNINISDSSRHGGAGKLDAAPGKRDNLNQAKSQSSADSSSKRESMESTESTDSVDSARQVFMDRSLEDLLNSPDIIGYPTPDEEDMEGLGDSFLLGGDLHDSETSSTTSGSSDDSCVYHYEVADAQMSKIKGEAPLAIADDGSSSSEDDSNSADENGLLNRHAIGDGGIVYTNTISESSRIFSDLQDMCSPLSALSGETAVSSEDFD